MALETDYVIELLLDAAKLRPEDREWLRRMRGTWMTSGQRRELSRMHERYMPRGVHGPVEAL